MEYNWNPWHGCHKLSPGCKNCYVFCGDERHGKNGAEIRKNADFDLPVKKGRSGYKIPSGSLVLTCFSSDFFLDEADLWREEAWRFIRERSDLEFFFITKRIHRFFDCIPDDWGDGYDNVTIGCTCENQAMAQFRLPLFVKAPIKHKIVICEPLLEEIDLENLLKSGDVESISAGGESGEQARVCDYDWVLKLRQFSADHDIKFSFHQTGARLKKDGRIYLVERRLQSAQARKANIDI